MNCLGWRSFGRQRFAKNYPITGQPALPQGVVRIAINQLLGDLNSRL